MIFLNGEDYVVCIIDVFLLGVVIVIDVIFEMGDEIMFGKMCICVVCWIEGGIVVEFVVVQNCELFENYILFVDID